ncbi:MAG: hypothetical protein Ct9H300mP3_11680 [Gammaproteobacteria bacterium]|nr:MAG: hypothetical protein Ct9H300mP3_11680 [Gammaproteobacteria bacterium]
MDSTPVIVISGQVKSHLIGTDSFQETDMIGVSRPIVKHSFLAQRAEDIPMIFKESISYCDYRKTWSSSYRYS